MVYGWILADRMGRRRYVRTVIKTGVIGFIVAFAPLFVVFLLPDIETEAPAFIATLIAVFAAAGMLIVYTAASIARLRDVRKHPGWVVAGLVPYLNIIFFVWLAFAEGERAKEKKSAIV
jgi:VIT1/CCC1 family predicted Fe2+/Mn2+ transporter